MSILESIHADKYYSYSRKTVMQCVLNNRNTLFYLRKLVALRQSYQLFRCLHDTALPLASPMTYRWLPIPNFRTEWAPATCILNLQYHHYLNVTFLTAHHAISTANWIMDKHLNADSKCRHVFCSPNNLTSPSEKTVVNTAKTIFSEHNYETYSVETVKAPAKAGAFTN